MDITTLDVLTSASWLNENNLGYRALSQPLNLGLRISGLHSTHHQLLQQQATKTCALMPKLVMAVFSYG